MSLARPPCGGFARFVVLSQLQVVAFEYIYSGICVYPPTTEDSVSAPSYGDFKTTTPFKHSIFLKTGDLMILLRITRTKIYERS